jgi:MtN3 and saliva related transmembrane protein
VIELIELVGFSAGILVAISSLPQLIKSWKTKSTTDVSLLWLIINLLGQITWMTYGSLKGSLSLVVMSFITLLMVGSVMGLKIKYG